MLQPVILAGGKAERMNHKVMLTHPDGQSFLEAAIDFAFCKTLLDPLVIIREGSIEQSFIEARFRLRDTLRRDLATRGNGGPALPRLCLQRGEEVVSAMQTAARNTDAKELLFFCADNFYGWDIVVPTTPNMASVYSRGWNEHLAWFDPGQHTYGRTFPAPTGAGALITPWRLDRELVLLMQPGAPIHEEFNRLGVYSFQQNGQWFDIGTPEGLRACWKWKELHAS